MIRLVYVSSAAQEFSEAELVALLAQSRGKNERLGITGMLLYKDGNFIQVLEGAEEAVHSLFQTISADSRHRGVLPLLEETGEREFPDWSMGFRNLNDPAIRNLPGFSEFMNQSLHSEAFVADPSRALRLLRVFRKNTNP